MSDTLYPLGIVMLTLAAVGALMVWQMRRTVALVAARRLGLLGGGAAGLGVALIVLAALTDRLDESSRWVGLIVAVALLLLPIVLANLGAQQASAMAARNATEQAIDVPTMKLEPGQRVVWSATLSSKWLLVPALFVLVLGPMLMLLPDTPVWLLAVTVFSGVACLSLASIRVTADAGGLRVKYGVLPWPATNISVDRITSASVIDVRPMEWGGWGYRGTLTLMRQAAVVLRAGPGIRVDLADGRVFVVTVDDPEIGVALLNAEVARL